jgi:hypothetical protein
LRGNSSKWGLASWNTIPVRRIQRNAPGSLVSMLAVRLARFHTSRVQVGDQCPGQL